jgi:hypothetical protein
MAGDNANSLGFNVVAVPAQWDTYGPAAGPIRNKQMLDLGPDLVIAFHNDLSKSRGTVNTVREAKRRGIPVEIIVEETK